MRTKRLRPCSALRHAGVRGRLPAARQALAEDTKTDPGLLRCADRPAARRRRRGRHLRSPNKRVPFGREEMQLSFAPLVKRRAGRGQCLCLANGAGALALRRRSVLRAVLRRPADAAARAVLAGLRRAGRSDRHRRHQLPRHPRRRRGQGRDRRRARIRQQGAAQGRVARPRGAEDRMRRAVPGRGDRRFRRARGRRPGAGHRQSVRRRPDHDQRHRLGARAHAISASPISASSSRPTPPSIPAIPAAR